MIWSIWLHAVSFFLAICLIWLRAVCSMVLLAFCSILLLVFCSKFQSRLPNTLINLIFLLTIYLMTILIIILFSLRNYTGTIDGNVCNLFKIWSALFRIFYRFFRSFMTTINMFSHNLVYGTYIFYIRFLYF